MPFSDQQISELNLLMQFNLNTAQQGIKVHSEASPEMHAAAKSLFDKGMISQDDGGYLTDLGIETADHLQHLRNLIA